MGKTVKRKSLKGRRSSILINGQESNQTSNILNVRFVLTPGGISSSGTRSMYRTRLIPTVSMTCYYRRLRLAIPRRPGFFLSRLRRQPVRRRRRVARASRSSLQNRQRNSNIRRNQIPNTTGPQRQDNQFPRRPLLKKEKVAMPLADQLSCANSIGCLGLTHIFHNGQDPSTGERTTTYLIMHAIVQTMLCFIFYFWLRNIRSP